MELRLEVSNIGVKSLLVANFASLYEGAEAYLYIELSNSKGLLSPRVGMAVDRFPSSTKEQKSPLEIVLNSFVLLRPGTSYVQRIPLSQHLSASRYEIKPGTYKLRAYYSSNGLFYPPAYQILGLTEEDVRSLPFQAWHGKVATNELSFTILLSIKKQ
ncbi:MAG: hypothetical protein ACHQT6_05445 [Candidatus Acidiferrales bacterium]